MIAERVGTSNRESTIRVDQHLQQQPVSPVVALRELYELLEAYSPMWYSEEAHNMASAALRQRSAH